MVYLFSKSEKGLILHNWLKLSDVDFIFIKFLYLCTYSVEKENHGTPVSPKLPGCHVLVSAMVPKLKDVHGLERENNPDRGFNLIARWTQVAKGHREFFSAKLYQDTVLLLLFIFILPTFKIFVSFIYYILQSCTKSMQNYIPICLHRIELWLNKGN